MNAFSAYSQGRHTRGAGAGFTHSTGGELMNGERTWLRLGRWLHIWSQWLDNCWAVYVYLPRRGYCVLHKTPSGLKRPYRI